VSSDPLLGAELRSMRHLLEWQVSRLAWNDFTRRAPSHAQLLKELTELGLASSLAGQLVAQVPVELGIEEARRGVLAQLSRRIAVTGDALLENGGRIALVGPTGVGKTTLIAKLAARWVKRQGVRDIALISVDGQRFGAHEQLRVLGRLLGVECLALESAAQLPEYLARLARHRLVLVDTAGASPRDPQLADRAAQFSQIAVRSGLDVWLSLSAGAQAGVLEEAMQRYAAFAPGAVLLTKLDEAASLGGALSALIGAQLPLAYVSEGTRIPEDLVPARAHQLVSRAVALSQISAASANEDLLVRRFGSTVHEFR
jgi:flagellar biosynthesis protein FlhF